MEDSNWRYVERSSITRYRLSIFALPWKENWSSSCYIFVFFIIVRKDKCEILQRKTSYHIICNFEGINFHFWLGKAKMNHLPTEKLPLLPQVPKLQLNPLIVTLTIIPRVIPHLLFLLSRCFNRLLEYKSKIFSMGTIHEWRLFDSPSQFRL